MEEVFGEIVDSARLHSCVKSSLGNVERLRKLERFFANDDHLYSLLEEELLKLLGYCEDDVYMQWLCGTLNTLRSPEWINRKQRLIAAICDVSFSGGPSLVGLALKSRILDKEEIIGASNQLPLSVLLQALRCIRDEDFVLDVAGRLTDESLLIMFLVHAMHTNPEAIEHYLSKPECLPELNRALYKCYDSHDPSLRRFSLALLKVYLETVGALNADLIVDMLTVAEQKQVHLVEPVLNLFVNAVRTSEWSEVPWTSLVFRRLFNHQTTWVKMQSLRSFFESTEFHRKVFQTHHEIFFCDSLLDSLDNVALYSREPNSRIGSAAVIGKCLREWMAGLQKNIDQEIFDVFLAAFVRAVCSRSKWSSVALLYVSEAILSLKPRPILDDLTPISTGLTLWPFQEPLLKKVITRYWLQIGCRFSRLVPTDKLADFINIFIEDCECVRDFIEVIRRPQSTPVDICSVIWSGGQTAGTFHARFENNVELWLSVCRVKNLATIRPDLKKILSSQSSLRYAIAVLNEGTCDDRVKRAVFEVLSLCDFDHCSLTETLRDSKPSWIFFCLWASRCPEPDQSVMKKYMSLLSLEEEVASLLSSDLAPHVFDCIAELCKSHPENSIDLLDFVGSALPLAPRAVTPSLLRLLLANLHRQSPADSAITRIVRLAWQSSLETRRATSLFAECAEVFLGIFFHPSTAVVWKSGLQSLFQDLESFVMNMAWFGEKFYGAMIQLLRTHPDFIAVLPGKVAEGICYGPIFRKDQKVVLDTENYVLATHKDPELADLSECRSAVSVRAKCISYVRSLDPSKAELVISGIHALDTAVSSTRKRYFNNSNIHRVKTRAWQANLVLLDSDFPVKRDILDSILDQLMNESHQMTVRIFMEWCAVKILLTTETRSASIETIVSAIEKASEERIGCICSYLNILMHLCCAANDCSLVSSCVPVVLPWTMCQHFAVRLHAQFIFKRVLELCRCPTNCNSQFEPQLMALTKVINYGGGAKNATKLHKDFYMAQCVVTECETYDLIFDKIPRAYGISDVDCIPAEMFVFDAKYSRNSDREIETEIQLEVLREDGERPDETTVVHESNFQRKIVPVTALFEGDRHPSLNSKDGLIVVASLIDRLPNLGGISRTCEIFGVSELVLPNLRMLETKEFQNLSVSSHQWLPIRGVGSQSIETYLREKRKDGYTLIGVEQTAKSVSLEKFRFPKKSLLLLGNEKEGMPLYLIHLMDTCVEIPQQGVVRSLNVHVSAAVLVWEYRKQFLDAT